MSLDIRKPALFLVILIGACAPSLTSGQTVRPTPQEQEEVIKVETELIDVPVVVTDKTGKPILDLKRSNFVVYEDGKQQVIEDFAATTAPFEVALLLDTSGSTRGDLELIRRAAGIFIGSMRPDDKVALVSFGSERDRLGGRAAPHVLAELSGDARSLRSALDGVSLSNGTPYYDGLIDIAEKIFKRSGSGSASNRRALVALTDGVDSTSITDFDEAKEMLEKLGIVTYFIKVDTREFFESELLGDCQSATRFSQAQIRRYYRVVGAKNTEKAANFCQLGDFERLAVSKALYELADKEMDSLAKASGGKVFPVADLSEARSAFRKVAAEIGTNYSLGYYSSNEKRDGKYRSIKVELKGLPAGAMVRAREGYTVRQD